MYCLRYELTLKSTYLENDIHLNRRGRDRRSGENSPASSWAKDL